MSVDGVPVVGYTLRCNAGSWSANPTFTYTFSDATSGEVLASGPSATYLLTAAVIGHEIRCEVAASTAGGTGVARTSPLPPVQPGLPSALALAPPPPPPLPVPAPAAVPSPGGGVLGTTSAHLGAQQLTALLVRLLSSAAKTARIATLLKAGRFVLTFSAPEAGTIKMSWYQAAHRATNGLLVARGQASFSSAGRVALKLELTARGRRLLEHVRSLKLTARAVLTPIGETPVAATRAFAIKR